MDSVFLTLFDRVVVITDCAKTQLQNREQQDESLLKSGSKYRT